MIGEDFRIGLLRSRQGGQDIRTGCLEETATFGPREAGQIALVSAGDSDIFIAKFAP